MPRIDLARLARDETLQVEARIPAEDPLWEETELRFDGPLRVRATASTAGSGEVVVRGTLEGAIVRPCRRCLAAVRTELDEDFTLVFSPVDEVGSTEMDPELRPLDPGADAIDLAAALREELMLEVDRYVVCDPGCRGLCPRCGTDLNAEECDCTLEEPDPRWDALRALQKD